MQKDLNDLIKKLNKPRAALAALSLLAVINAIAYLAVAIETKFLIDFISERNTEAMRQYIPLLALTVIFTALSQYAIVRYRVNRVTHYKNRLAESVYGNLLKGDPSRVKNMRSADVMLRLTSDTEITLNGYFGLLPLIISISLKAVGGLVILTVINYELTLLAMGGGLVITGVILSSRKSFKKKHGVMQDKIAITKGYIIEGVNGLDIIRSYGIEDKYLGILSEKQEQARLAIIRRSNISNIISATVQLLFNATFYAALIFGATEILRENMPLTDFIVALQLLEIMRAPFRQASELGTLRYSMLESAGRVNVLASVKCDAVITVSEWNAVELRKVGFFYGEDKVLDGADCIFRRGESVAVSGASGEGKSTLLKLLLGLLKCNQGDIMTDGGQKLIDAAYVPQTSLILSGSIKENLLLVRQNASEKEIEAACRTAVLHGEILELSGGYNYNAGEMGANLSAGQAQRLAIARAVLSGKNTIVLDEATAHLDAAAEAEIIGNLLAIKGITLIAVTHSAAAAELFDKKLYVKNGKISEVVREQHR